MKIIIINKIMKKHGQYIIALHLAFFLYWKKGVFSPTNSN